MGDHLLRVAFLAALLAGSAVGCSTGGCAVGLQDGTLVALGDSGGGGPTLVIAHDDGRVDRIDWEASGRRVRREEDGLVVTDGFGLVVQAREGDRVRAGIGDSGGAAWICSSFEVIGRAPP